MYDMDKKNIFYCEFFNKKLTFRENGSLIIIN